MGNVTDKLRNQVFEEKVIMFIKDVDLIYSRVDKKYMTNEKVNYSSYTAGELIDRLEIHGDTLRLLFKKLIRQHATKTDVALPDLLTLDRENEDD